MKSLTTGQHRTVGRSLISTIESDAARPSKSPRAAPGRVTQHALGQLGESVVGQTEPDEAAQTCERARPDVVEVVGRQVERGQVA